MSAWADIVKRGSRNGEEKEKEKEKEGLEDAASVSVSVLAGSSSAATEAEDADAQLAALLQEQENNIPGAGAGAGGDSSASDEDANLAALLQSLEYEDVAILHKHAQTQAQAQFSKITISSGHEIEAPTKPRTANSGSWAAAVAQEKKLSKERSHGLTPAHYRHDPLLRGMTNSNELTEIINGAGDLTGLIIDDVTSNSLKNSTKTVGIKKDKSHR